MNNNETISDIFSDIANSIRTKTGKDNLIAASEMSEEISNIPTQPTVEGLLLQRGATYKLDNEATFIFCGFVNNTTAEFGLINTTSETLSAREYKFSMRLADGTEFIELSGLYGNLRSFYIDKCTSSYSEDLTRCTYCTIRRN